MYPTFSCGRTSPKLSKRLDAGEETRNALDYAVWMNWKEDQGVEGRSCIMQIIKEEWKNIKPRVLR